MIARLLRSKLEPVARRQNRWQLWKVWSLCWIVAAALGFGLILLDQQTGWILPKAAPALGVAAGVAAIIVWWRLRSRGPDWQQIARNIEQHHPELQALLLTAVEQKPDPQTGQLNYLQERVVRDALEKASKQQWSDTVSGPKLFGMLVAHGAALVLLIVVLFKLQPPAPGTPEFQLARGLTVTPGDTTVERGSGLVVLARFKGFVPAEATLVTSSAPGQIQRLPLSRNLSDPVFGGGIPEVQSNLVYYVEYAGRRTRDFTVRVFEYPRLERADAQIKYPEYTGLPEKRIEDTRRISAVEGSRLSLALQLNKPVVSAKLVGKDQSVLPLGVDARRAHAELTNFLLAASQSYQLKLVDAEGRTNKLPAQFIIEVQTNRAPELRLASPRGDQRVSALEEVAFQAEASDDFGLRAYGLTYRVAGKESQVINLGNSGAAFEKRRFSYLLPMETLKVEPDQLISYFVWADDQGPDGKIRRTSSDLYFAEVRPFDEIFRQSQSAAANSSSQSESESQGDQQNPTTKLADLQKQIILATWKLQRLETGPTPSRPYLKDAPLVKDSQEQALEQAQELKLAAENPQTKATLETVETAMNQALNQLTKATNSPAALPGALQAEESAYQALLKLQAREFQVSQGRSQSRGRGAASARSQRQLNQMELTASENRYETQREAASPQSAQQREQLQVQNRLKELAQRQQDLNDRLKELQTALQEAKTAAEKEDIRRRLKRLREEERQMLADVDELKQRTEQANNQSRLAETRRDLEQTRSDVQRAAEAMDQEAVPEALTSGTRAQRSLQQMRDALRQQSSSQFAEDMRQMRTSARELSQKQEEIENQLQALAEPKRRTLSSADERNAVVNQLNQQKKQYTNLIDQATQVSQQAEAAEPLLSNKLYDTLRQIQQEQIDTTLDATAELLRGSFVPQATQIERRARQGIEQLKQGVERAAESVLGDETEALRLARKEIEDLTRQVENEVQISRSNALANLAASGIAGLTNLAANPTANSGTNRPGQLANAENRPAQSGLTSSNNASGTAPSPNRLAQGGRRPPTDGQGQQPGLRNRNGREGSTDQARDSTDAVLNRLLQARDRGQEGGFNQGGGPTTTGPITGPDYLPWSERLRDVEEMLELPDLRNEIARIRDRAQTMRAELKRHGNPPQWSLIQSQIVEPLAEVRGRLTEELARRESKESLVPLDRDPVPQRFSELVRRYYEQLGSDQ